MSALIDRCREAGIRLWVEGNTLRYDAPKGTVTPDLLAEIKLHKPGIVAALASGTTPEFAARLSAEDLEDIAAGDISLRTVQAFEQAAIAREAEDLKIILEHDAGLPRPEAELEAARLAAAYARNNGYLWSSLRAALADYPVLVPDRPGKVDGLPLGVVTVHVRKGGRVLKQGVFAGAQEVRI